MVEEMEEEEGEARLSLATFARSFAIRSIKDWHLGSSAGIPFASKVCRPSTALFISWELSESPGAFPVII